MVISIDIGSRYIHIVEGKYIKGQFKIQKAISTLTPENSIDDGEILDENSLVLKLKNTLSKHKIRTKKVIFCINPGSLIKRRIEIPQVATKEALKILQNQLEANIPTTEPYLVDYTEVEGLGDHMMGIEAIALPRRIIEQYKSISKKLRLTPYALDITSNAVSKFLHATTNKISEPLIISDIGNNYMNLYLFNEGICVFSKKTFINTEQYERMLVSSGKIKKLNEDFHYLSLSPQALDNDAQLEGTMSLYLYNIVDQLQRMIQFHLGRNSAHDRINVSQIYLCGGMTQMEGLGQYIRTSTEIPVQPIETIVNKDVCDCKEVEKYINALGAMIRTR